MRSDGCPEWDIPRYNFQSSWDQNLVPCLEPKESNIAWEYKRVNPLFSSDLLCGTATASHSHGCFLFSTTTSWLAMWQEHFYYHHYAVLVHGLLSILAKFCIWGPLLIQESYSLYYVTTFVCVSSLAQWSHNNSVAFEEKYSYTQWDWRFLAWWLCQKLPLKCAWKCLCDKTSFHYYFHPILVKSTVKIRWKVIPGFFPGFQSWTTLFKGRSWVHITKKMVKG